jgi:hypothetical protein
VGGTAGPPRHAHGEPGGGEQQPPLPVLERGGAGVGVRVQGPGLARPGGALGRAHRGLRAVRELPVPRLQRQQHQRRVRGEAAADLPAAGRRHRREPGAAGRAEPRPLRQRLLPQRRLTVRPAPLRPGALRRRAGGRRHGAVRAQRRGLHAGLRDGHDQDGEHQPAHGVQRRDPRQLPEAQLISRGPAPAGLEIRAGRRDGADGVDTAS